MHEALAPSFVYHTAQPPLTPDRDGFIQEAIMLRSAFPDLRFTSDDTVLEGDKIVIRWTMRGTHEGDFLGIPPTHRHVTWSGIGLAWTAGGKDTDVWNFPDLMGLLQQLGAFPQASTGQRPEAPQPQA
jgi:predicted ester cyclase